MPSNLLISLDFELHWGGSEKWLLDPLKPYFLETRRTIPEMLRLFEKYEIAVTWATVGLLFHESRDEMLASLPETRPAYSAPISAYDYIENEGVGENEEHDPFHFAPSLIRQIINTPKQELATHTYSHYYCNEEGQTPDQFQEDLRAAQKVAKEKFGRTMKSLVFPRNQFNEEYLEVCKLNGITSVRSNPDDWFWNIESTQGESKWKRLVRGADAYVPLGNVTSYKTRDLPKTRPLQIPASRLYRPYTAKEASLNRLKVQRILKEMDHAAENNETYHLWWHPHNFGNYSQQNLADLETILMRYKKLHITKGMESQSMLDYTQSLIHA